MQDRVYPASQAFRDVLDDRRRPNHFRLARDPVESGLGPGPSEVLGVQTDA